MANATCAKDTINKCYFISGYAVNPKGYARGVQMEVKASNINDAISTINNQLRCEGVVNFKLLRVVELK